MLSDDRATELKEYELILRQIDPPVVAPLGDDLGTVFGLAAARLAAAAVKHYVRTGAVPAGARFVGDARAALDELRALLPDPTRALVTLRPYGAQCDSDL